MADIPRDLESAIMSLPREERAELAKRLLASLDLDDSVAAAWAQEITARVNAYRAGTAETVNAEVVFDEARARLKR